jgi:hypothetical protein
MQRFLSDRPDGAEVATANLPMCKEDRWPHQQWELHLDLDS